MEIRKSFNRFASIFLIVALGVAFFAGLQATAPDMRASGDAYFDAENLMDLKVISTMGLTEDDVQALEELDGVRIAEGAWMTDVLSGDGVDQRVLHMESITENFQKLTVSEGALPQKAGECFIDEELAELLGLSVGDTITVAEDLDESSDSGSGGSDPDTSDAAAESEPESDSEVATEAESETEPASEAATEPDSESESASEAATEPDSETEPASEAATEPDSESESASEAATEPDSETESASEAATEPDSETDAQEDEDDGGMLAVTEYVITGIGSSPQYISFSRGNSTLGSGEVSGVLYVTPDSFDADYYTQIWMEAEGAKELLAFSDEYEALIDEVEAQVEGIEEVRCQARRDEIVAEAESELQDGWDELAQAESELEEGRLEAESELAEAESEIADGEQQLEEGRQELEDAKQELEENRQKLEDARQEIDSGYTELESGRQEIESNRQTLNSSQAEYDTSAAQLADGWAQLAQARETLDSNEADYAANAETTNAQLAEAEAAITQAEDELDQQAAQIEEGRTQLSLGWSEYESQKSQLEAAAAASPEGQAALEAAQPQLEQTRQQLEATQNELDAAESQINTARLSLEAQKEEVASGRQQLADARAQLDAAWEEYYAQEAQLNAAQAQADSGAAQLTDGWSQISSGEAQLTQAEADLAQAEQELADGEQQIADAESEIADGEAELAENEQKLADARQEYEDAKAEAEADIADGEKEIADARADLEDAEAEIADIEMPEWSITTRADDTDYTGYSDNTDRMASIAQVFPVMFFLVAALISLTTMTRMVEEERTQIGTLKALGYGKISIAMKYINYALLATISGSIVGALFGQKFLPFVIIEAYGIMYTHMDALVLPYQMDSAGLATVLAVACTTLAAISACYKELLATPAVLMRPPSPKEGKRVLLERIGFIWNHLNFTWKSTIRNLFRYKKRFFMTIFGIGGCMALLVVGFGLRDCIMDIAVIQYSEIQVYEAAVILDEDAGEAEKEALDAAIQENTNITGAMKAYMKNMTMRGSEGSRDVYLMVPERLDGFEEFVHLRDRITQEEYSLDDSGLILSEKTAKLLGAEVGDEITMEPEPGREISVTISAICENYMLHYAYLSPALYMELFGETPEYNNILISTDLTEQTDIEQVGRRLLREDAALSISYTSSISSQLNDMLGALDLVIVVIIISAGLLALVVLYNLNNINISERQRELATLKVLGFYDREVSAYMYRENILLTVIGALLGIALGYVLLMYTVQTVEIDDCMFGREVKPLSYLVSFLITCAFSALVNVVMHFRLKKIDMVESLKSVE